MKRNSLYWKGIAIIVIVLFIGMGINPLSATLSVEKSSIMSFDGNTLYVGGSGPNNYTKIQDAIDNASDGDTVYVYSGIYFENVIVDKSIHLIGEDRNSTYIDGSQNEVVINITANAVHIEGFTITRGRRHGIYSQRDSYNIVIMSCKLFDNNDPKDHFGQICLFEAQQCLIYENIVFSSDNRGIAIHFGNNNEIYRNLVYYNTMWGGIDVIHCSNNLIYENIAHSNMWGISINNGSDNHVFNNTVYKNDFGFMVDWPCHGNIISNNNAEGNNAGVFIGGHDADDNIISNNTISLGFFGIQSSSEGNTIQHNVINNMFTAGIGIGSTSINYVIENYVNDSKIAIIIVNTTDTQILRNTFIDIHLREAFFLQFSFSRMNNLWDGNYWGSPRFLPKPIFGIMKIGFIPIPWVNFDWHPAKEPYDM